MTKTLRVELLWQTMTSARWALLEVMTGQGAMSIRKVAQQIGRDMKSVHSDVHALLDAGILNRTSDGRIVFPY